MWKIFKSSPTKKSTSIEDTHINSALILTVVLLVLFVSVDVFFESTGVWKSSLQLPHAGQSDWWSEAVGLVGWLTGCSLMNVFWPGLIYVGLL
jgi:hypothetical protein